MYRKDRNHKNLMSMSMSIINLYSAESWSISTALCVLSGNAGTSSSSTVVGNDHCWEPSHGDCPVDVWRMMKMFHLWRKNLQRNGRYLLTGLNKTLRDRWNNENGPSSCPICVWQMGWNEFSTGTVAILCMLLKHHIWLKKQQLFQ